MFDMDGASYHKSIQTRTLLADLGIKFVISAPYSYHTAPCELVFSQFKQGELNPANHSMGKK
jgi:hypothetical protein